MRSADNSVAKAPLNENWLDASGSLDRSLVEAQNRDTTQLDSSGLVQLAIIASQLALLILVIFKFQIESQAFLELVMLAFFGFFVHHFLPLGFRLPFFSALSVVGIALVLGVVNCAWVLGIGGVLIGIAHLPIAMSFRVTIMLAAMTVLIALRASWIEAPWSSAIWPIIGSMFMFRMIIYMYDLKNKAAPTSVWWAMSYFFMLPNVCFPLFPVVDYKTFFRTYHNLSDRFKAYQTGIIWMFRGLIHLLIYRLIMQNFVVDEASINSAGMALQYVIATYLLYLYVSGSFAFIVGLLHLFGFNLHDTHHNFLLASSFTDFWRRINIYWKEFMEKIFFRPAYYGLSKRVGPNLAMVLAILYAFAFTWFLHSVQWFWIRGDFPVTWQDGTFWTMLACLLIVSAIYELKYGRQRSLTKVRKTFKSELKIAFRTIGTFAFISVLWSMWNIGSYDALVILLRELARQTSTSLIWLLVILGGLGTVAVLIARTKTERLEIGVDSVKEGSIAASWRPALSVIVLCAMLLIIGRWPQSLVAPVLSDTVYHLKDRDSLGKRDAELLQRGYYEDLTNTSRYSRELASLYARKPIEPVDWNFNATLHKTEDFPFRFLRPSMSTEFKGGVWSTNRWGMRDREYDKEALPGTFRIAMVGASNTAGSGVNDGENFESLVENMLNSFDTNDQIKRFEILNFGVPGYGPFSSLAALQNRMLEFNPDVLISVRALGRRSAINDLLREDKLWHIPYDEVRQILNHAGIEPGMSRIEIDNRINPYAEELDRWVYGQLVAECRKHGIRPVALFLPLPSSRIPQADIDGWENIAREAGFDLIEMSGAYEDVDQKTLWVANWDRHPNDKGHQLLAKKLYAGLRDILLTSNQPIN